MTLLLSKLSDSLKAMGIYWKSGDNNLLNKLKLRNMNDFNFVFMFQFIFNLLSYTIILDHVF